MWFVQLSELEIRLGGAVQLIFLTCKIKNKHCLHLFNFIDLYLFHKSFETFIKLIQLHRFDWHHPIAGDPKVILFVPILCAVSIPKTDQLLTSPSSLFQLCLIVAPPRFSVTHSFFPPIFLSDFVTPSIPFLYTWTVWIPPIPPRRSLFLPHL